VYHRGPGSGKLRTMQTTAPQHSRSAAAAGHHVYLRPSVRPLPRPRLVEAATW
jgi:hypothetical protein